MPGRRVVLKCNKFCRILCFGRLIVFFRHCLKIGLSTVRQQTIRSFSISPAHFQPAERANSLAAEALVLAGASLDDGTIGPKEFLLNLCYLLARERQRYSFHSERYTSHQHIAHFSSYFYDRPTDRPTDRDRSFDPLHPQHHVHLRGGRNRRSGLRSRDADLHLPVPVRR